MMIEGRERRAVPRTGLVARPGARVRGLQEVRLLDLSIAGAKIEHLDLFRPGASCTLDLPPPCGPLSLSAQVVWCAVVGRRRKLGADSHLVARTGLRFTTLTEVQRQAITDSLRQLAAAVQADRHRRSA